MREDGLEGFIGGCRRRTTVPEPAAPRPLDPVNRLFTATRPNQLWVADLTYVRMIHYSERLRDIGAAASVGSEVTASGGIRAV